jgi:hypothetical protein
MTIGSALLDVREAAARDCKGAVGDGLQPDAIMFDQAGAGMPFELGMIAQLSDSMLRP